MTTVHADEKGGFATASQSSSNEGSPHSKERAGEVYELTGFDPVLAKKIAAVNDAIDEIGLTPYHWKLFCLNGFGYAVDSVCKPFETANDHKRRSSDS